MRDATNDSWIQVTFWELSRVTIKKMKIRYHYRYRYWDEMDQQHTSQSIAPYSTCRGPRKIGPEKCMEIMAMLHLKSLTFFHGEFEKWSSANLGVSENQTRILQSPCLLVTSHFIIRRLLFCWNANGFLSYIVDDSAHFLACNITLILCLTSHNRCFDMGSWEILQFGVTSTID